MKSHGVAESERAVVHAIGGLEVVPRCTLIRREVLNYTIRRKCDLSWGWYLNFERRIGQPRGQILNIGYQGEVTSA